MTLTDRIDLLAALGTEIISRPEWLHKAVERAFYENRWFTPESSWQAIEAIAINFLDREILSEWISSYSVPNITANQKKVGLVLAGNIPLVGFHDLLCSFVSGHATVAKVSSKDKALLTAIVDWMKGINAEIGEQILLEERLNGFDAVIATGSNNSSTYFHQYFGKYPHIIRKNRSAIGVLTGDETDEEIVALGHDIFNYFGLGCRNVAKIYVPQDYTFDRMLTILHDNYKEVVNHTKYKNNFDYNYALFLLNKVEFLMSGSLIITEADSMSSRIATLHYERYTNLSSVTEALQIAQEEIQCIVSSVPLSGLDTFAFGQAQSPKISNYADGVDTMSFLMDLA